MINLILRPEIFQPRNYIEPIPTSGERDGNFDMNAILAKKEKSEHARKNGILPRIKKLSVKRKSNEDNKKYKYNLKVTPAEQLFGADLHLSDQSSLHEVGSADNGKEESLRTDVRPVSRLDNYPDISPISLDLDQEIGETVSKGSKFHSNDEVARQTQPRIIATPPSPSCLLLQIAPKQDQVSSAAGSDAIPQKHIHREGSKHEPAGNDNIIYADIEHNQTKGNFIRNSIPCIYYLDRY